MDHQLIDDALAELASIPPEARSPNQILSWARLICIAAGAPIEETPALHLAQLELHAATALLAQKLGTASYSTEYQIKANREPSLSAFIYVREGVGLYGLGSSSEEVLRSLHQAATKCRPLVA